MNNPFKGKNVATSGLTDTIVSPQIGIVKYYVEILGGQFQMKVTDTTNCLVYDSEEGVDTPEMRKAKDTQAKGKDLQIVSFGEFQKKVLEYRMETWPKGKTVIEDGEFLGFTDKYRVEILT